MDYLSKRNLAIATVLLFGVSVFLQWYKISSICGFSIGDVCGSILFNIKMGTGVLFLILFPVFFALLLSQRAFSEWRRFAIWAVPAMAVIVGGILLLDTGSSGGWGMVPIDLAPLLILPIYAVYLVASLVVIYRAWRRK